MSTSNVGYLDALDATPAMQVVAESAPAPSAPSAQYADADNKYMKYGAYAGLGVLLGGAAWYYFAHHGGKQADQANMGGPELYAQEEDQAMMGGDEGGDHGEGSFRPPPAYGGHNEGNSDAPFADDDDDHLESRGIGA